MSQPPSKLHRALAKCKAKFKSVFGIVDRKSLSAPTQVVTSTRATETRVEEGGPGATFAKSAPTLTATQSGNPASSEIQTRIDEVDNHANTSIPVTASSDAVSGVATTPSHGDAAAPRSEDITVYMQSDHIAGQATNVSITTASVSSPVGLVADPMSLAGHLSSAVSGPGVDADCTATPTPPPITSSSGTATANDAINANTATTGDSTEPSEAPWYFKRTPQWNAAVVIWGAEYPAHFLELKKLTERSTTTPMSGADALFRLQPAKESSNEIVARMKRWQPALASARGIAMAAANFDPHKVAPIVCASVLFGINVSKLCHLLMLANNARLFSTA